MWDRRSFLQASGAALLWAALPESVGAQGHLSSPGSGRDDGLAAADLRNWITVVGDAYRPGMGEVVPGDVTTVHMAGGLSEIQANVQNRRDVMAHNITYLRRSDAALLTRLHTFTCEFRLPVMPDRENTDYNGQTFEGGITLWDGLESRLRTTVGFQWIVNPWSNAGVVNGWEADPAPIDSDSSGHWVARGHLPLDTAWHQLMMWLDPVNYFYALQIDGVAFPATAVVEPGPASWGSDQSGVIAVEAISIDPGAHLTGGRMHRVQVRNWRWQWASAKQENWLYLPVVTAGP
jgi:hypothetical protein